jgi:hypothetical protein
MFLVSQLSKILYLGALLFLIFSAALLLVPGAYNSPIACLQTKEYLTGFVWCVK